MDSYGRNSVGLCLRIVWCVGVSGLVASLSAAVIALPLPFLPKKRRRRKKLLLASPSLPPKVGRRRTKGPSSHNSPSFLSSSFRLCSLSLAARLRTFSRPNLPSLPPPLRRKGPSLLWLGRECRPRTPPHPLLLLQRRWKGRRRRNSVWRGLLSWLAGWVAGCDIEE